MKVSESGGEYRDARTPCDFCNRATNYLNPINDGLWAICNSCYAHVYDDGEEE
jgi:hypothetical protein